MQNQIDNILNDMSESLNIIQMKELQEVLIKRLVNETEDIEKIENDEYMEMFLSAKQVEGCSVRTIKYYRSTISRMMDVIGLPVRKITTETIRKYLRDYQSMKYL